jgi:hypothetical protein
VVIFGFGVGLVSVSLGEQNLELNSFQRVSIHSYCTNIRQIEVESESYEAGLVANCQRHFPWHFLARDEDDTWRQDAAAAEEWHHCTDLVW